jgi:hypothetical protein
LLGRDAIERLVEDRNETGGGNQLRMKKTERWEKEGERETNVTSWCVLSYVVGGEAK